MCGGIHYGEVEGLVSVEKCLVLNHVSHLCFRKRL